jgi:hypothetical protein
MEKFRAMRVYVVCGRADHFWARFPAPGAPTRPHIERKNETQNELAHTAGREQNQAMHVFEVSARANDF